MSNHTILARLSALLLLAACGDAASTPDAAGSNDGSAGAQETDGSLVTTTETQQSEGSGAQDTTGGPEASTTSGSGDSSGGDTGDSGEGDCVSPWQFEVVDEAAGRDSDIEVAVDGSLSIFYIGGTFPQSQMVRHAQREGGEWTVSEIAETLSQQPNLPNLYPAGVMLDGAIDADGGRHALLRCPDLRPCYAHNSGAGWTVETMFTVGVSAVRLNPSIVVRGDGVVEALYRSTYAFNGPDQFGLMLGDSGSGAWAQTQVVAGAGDGHTAFAELDSTHHVGFVPGMVSHGPPAYSTDASGAWTTETIAPEFDWATAVELVVNSDGAPFLAFHGAGDKRPEGVYLASRNGKTWEVDLVAEAAIDHVAMQPRLGLGLTGSGDLQLAFAGPDAVLYAHGKPGVWDVEQVGDSPRWGDSVSLSTDDRGTPHIAFRSLESTPLLMYATRRCEEAS